MKKTTLAGHLRHLRLVMIPVLLAFIVFLVCGYVFYSDRVVGIFVDAIRDSPGVRSVFFISVESGFVLKLKASIALAMLLVSPVLMFSIWVFAYSGMYTRERYLFLGMVVLFVLIGCGSAWAFYEIVLPMCVRFFMGFDLGVSGVGFDIDVNSYFDFVLSFLLCFVFLSELPLLLIVLVQAGFVDKRALKKCRKYAVVGSFAVGAVVTPPDLMSQVIAAAVIYLSYELSLVIPRVYRKNCRDLHRGVLREG